MILRLVLLGLASVVIHASSPAFATSIGGLPKTGGGVVGPEFLERYGIGVQAVKGEWPASQDHQVAVTFSYSHVDTSPEEVVGTSLLCIKVLGPSASEEDLESGFAYVIYDPLPRTREPYETVHIVPSGFTLILEVRVYNYDKVLASAPGGPFYEKNSYVLAIENPEDGDKPNFHSQ